MTSPITRGDLSHSLGALGRLGGTGGIWRYRGRPERVGSPGAAGSGTIGGVSPSAMSGDAPSPGDGGFRPPGDSGFRSSSDGGFRSRGGDVRRDGAVRGRPAPGEDDAHGWSERGPAAIGRRLRRPHRRRAKEGQATGLDPNLASDLPTWLAQERVEVARPRRLRSLSMAAFSGLLGLALLLGAQVRPGSFGLVIFGVQALFVLAWTVAMRPPGARVVAGVGLAAAVAADLAVAWPDRATLAPLAYVTAGAVIVGVVGQLARGAKRQSPTESLGATLLVVVGVVALASLVVLGRHPLGTQSITACLAAAGTALVVAHLLDILLPAPRTSSQVARGSIGVVVGAMAGTGAAVLASTYLVGLHPGSTAAAGLVTAMAAIMADLGASYADASRELDGAPGAWWFARHLQGPLGGYALAGAAAYVLSVILLIPNL